MRDKMNIRYEIRMSVGILPNMTTTINGEKYDTPLPDDNTDDVSSTTDTTRLMRLVTGITEYIHNNREMGKIVIDITDPGFNKMYNRMSFITKINQVLAELDVSWDIICILTITPYDICMERMGLSEDAFMEHATSFELPFFYEGFSRIDINWDLGDWNESIRYYVNYEASEYVLKQDGYTGDYSLKDMILDIPLMLQPIITGKTNRTGNRRLMILKSLQFYMISKVKHPNWIKGGNIVDAYYSLLYLSANEVQQIIRIRPNSHRVLYNAIILQWIDSVPKWLKNNVMASQANKLLGVSLYRDIVDCYMTIDALVNAKCIDFQSDMN